MTPVIRQATLHDLDTIVANNLAMAQETEELALAPAVLRPGVEAVLAGRVDAFYRLAQESEGGPVIGQLMITREWSDWRNAFVWWIQSVYVPPEARGRGVYRALYEHARAEAMAAGAAGLRLYVDLRNARARAVYERLGMRGDHYQVFEAMFDRG
jgi:ribosomal protein S18 acetylase RimI-like enzyme